MKASGKAPLAVFYDAAAGEQAVKNNLGTTRYQSQTILGAMNIYAPSSDNNNPSAYASFLVGQIGGGVTTSTLMSSLTDSQLTNMVKGIEIKEGNTPGSVVCDPAATP